MPKGDGGHIHLTYTNTPAYPFTYKPSKISNFNSKLSQAPQKIYTHRAKFKRNVPLYKI
jgi:hypothetical protein